MESKSDAAISAAIEIMRQNNEFPGLQTALAKLVAASTAAAAADAAAPAAAVPAAASAPAVPAASAPAVPAASTAAAAAPAAAAVPAPAAAPAADAVPAVENDDNSEINDSEVIKYNDGKTSSSYRAIIRMLEETLGQEDMLDDDKNKIRNLMIAVMHSKKPTEVQTLMNEFGTLDQVGEGPTAYYKITDKKGGTRKHRNKRNKLQRKRVKTMKNKKKKKAGKRK